MSTSMMAKHHVQVELMLSLQPILEGESKEITDIFHPGDLVYGRLAFSSRKAFHIMEVSVFLEGTSRNWVSHFPPAVILPEIAVAERKFLSQALDIDFSQINQPRETSAGFTSPIECKCSTDFRFVIATQVPSAGDQAPDHCLQLPPSIEMGSAMLDKKNRKRYAQPNISYAVRTAITFAPPNSTVAKIVHASVPITLRPYTIEYPPTAIDDFPSEFKVKDHRSVRWWAFGRTIGTLTVSVREPQPISFNNSTQSGVTSCPLEIQLLPAEGGDNNFEALRYLRATVEPILRIKTFYSVKTFPKVPSQKLLHSEKNMGMQEDLIRLSDSKISNISWVYRRNSVASSFGGSQSSETLIDDASSTSSAAGGIWMAEVGFPVLVKGTLVPTFCSSIVARLYTLRLRITVAGIYKETYDLEVPVQVIHPSPEPLYDDNSVFNRSNEFDGASLATRTSAGSWFSDDTLEEPSSPPKYFP